MMTLRLIALGTLLASGIVHAGPFALDTEGLLSTIVTPVSQANCWTATCSS